MTGDLSVHDVARVTCSGPLDDVGSSMTFLCLLLASALAPSTGSSRAAARFLLTYSHLVAVPVVAGAATDNIVVAAASGTGFREQQTSKAAVAAVAAWRLGGFLSAISAPVFGDGAAERMRDHDTVSTPASSVGMDKSASRLIGSSPTWAAEACSMAETHSTALATVVGSQPSAATHHQRQPSAATRRVLDLDVIGIIGT